MNTSFPYRRFLILITFVATLFQLSFSQGKLSPGVQLYTLRNQLEQNCEATLDSIKKIGYNSVELAGTCGLPPDSLAAVLESKKLKVLSMHLQLADFDSLPAVIRNAKLFGAEHVALAWINPAKFSTPADYRNLARNLNTWGEKLRKAGICLSYHNHDFEFRAIQDTIPYHILLNQTDPRNVSFELDVYWYCKAGGNAEELVKNHHPRLRLIHLKDMGPDPDREMMPVGEGVIDFGRLLGSFPDLNGHLFFVEHDNAENPLESIRKSYEFISSLGL